jgi:GntR family transcriptional regulator / MocR family aminotransferase
MRASPNPRRGAAAGYPLITLVGRPGAAELPLRIRVYRQIREHILGGSLDPGARLPSARTLARDLAVSRNTVEAALGQLDAEGFIQRRSGSGTFVAAALPDVVPFVRQERARRVGPAMAGRLVAPRLSTRGRLTAELGGSEIEAYTQFGPCAADMINFPVGTWNRLLVRRMRQGPGAPLLPADAAGVPALRQAIAEYLRLARGVRCEPGQILVLNSTQQAVDLAARLLLDPGAVAVMEEPGYPSARAALRVAGVRVVGVPVDEEGLSVDALDRVANVRLVYVTPSHQYPLGVTMSLGRRLAVVGWAARTGAWVLEDDYDSEFRYDGRPLAALQGLDPAGRTLYAGTFNKILFPGLRLAYLVLPPSLVDAFAAGRRLLDGFSSPLTQLVVADFISSGHFTTHLRQARLRYRTSRDALVTGVAAEWGDRARLGPADTGLHLVAHLPPGSDDQRIARAAPAGGMAVAPLSHYYLERPARAGLLLSFGGASQAQIRRTLPALATHLPRAKWPPD